MNSPPGTNDRGDTAVQSPDEAVTPAASLSVDATFYILSNRRRRYVCRYLLESEDGTTGFDELVDAVVAREADADGESDADHRKRVHSDLFHAHVPQLADAGLLDYDRRSDTIRYWGHPRLDAWVLRAADEEFDA